MIVSAIVAAGHDNVIGKDNELPWYLPADLKFFKRTTSGHHIIMGRKCFESIGKPLPKRTNIILSRNPYYVVSNCIVCTSIEEALSLAEEQEQEEVFIIGGGEIYKAAWEYLDRIYITEVDIKIEGENLTYFPEVDEKEWNLISKDDQQPDERNEYKYSFLLYERRA